MTCARSIRASVLALCAALSCAPAIAAADTWLNVGGISKHLSASADGLPFQEVNPGLGIELPYRGALIGAGFYRNSLDRESKYLVAEKAFWRFGPVGVGGMIGIVDGYAPRNGGFIPLIAPSVTIEGDRLGLRFIFVPQVEKKIASVLAVQIRLKLQ